MTNKRYRMGDRKTTRSSEVANILLKRLWQPISLVMFDFDDTLMTTAKTRWNALIATAEYFGLHLDEDTIRKYWGRPFDHLIASLFPGLDFDTFLPKYSEIMKRYKPDPTPGARELLTWLHSSGRRLEILTSSREDLIRQDLEEANLDHFFSTIWDHRQTDPYHKPDRHVFDPIFVTWRRDDIDIDHVVYIGDSVCDFQAAEGNHVRFFGVTTGLEAREDFLDANLPVDRIFDTLEDLVPSG